ncbi:MAG: ribbon-helix-helix protein, CopG family [Euryarchaeota archaeon]|jgi:Arc/MetJ-type ribon-helix-helix transcriptional regulator|nr:ribbon-helix-helix protein, CopG family [Euryarchaeota archaeon]MBT5255002.1 ribbon-helix-helix protein, CopG family [Euryarchaeota archaeon]
MSKPSNLVSLRITEDDLNELEARVGLDGARNRSDVIRLAIQQFLQGQPLLPEMDTVRITIGRANKMHLGQLYELQGISPETACQEGLKLYIANAIKQQAELNEKFESALEVSRAATIRREEYHE